MHPQKRVSAPTVRVNRWYIQMLMAAKKVSKTAVAREAGVHLVTVSKVLSNRKHVAHEKRVAVLRAIASLCGCEIEELVLGRLAA